MTPTDTARALTHRASATLPGRAWERFRRRNGLLLSAGVSYQALFALSATIYLVFVFVGVGLDARGTAVGDLIDLVDSYIPGLISRGGILTPNQVQQIADGSRSTLTVTGLVAIAAAVWTSVAWVTYTRRAVRQVLGLPPDPHSFLRLKAVDLIAAVLFGAALLLGGVVSSAGEISHTLLGSALGLHPAPGVEETTVRAGAIVVTLVVDTAALAALFRFLTGSHPTTRALVTGSLLGGTALAALQLSAGAFLSRGSLDPVLATFAAFVGVLLWFRLVGIVIVAAAAWVGAASARERSAAARPSEGGAHPLS